MKDDNDFLSLHNILEDVGYTGAGERPSKLKRFSTIDLSQQVAAIEAKMLIEVQSDVLQGKE